MQDRPTAGELLRAVRDFLERDLMPELEGRRRFHTRVAANLLEILEREWQHEESHVRAEYGRLARLLGTTEDAPPPTFEEQRRAVAEMNTALARKIRTGELDGRWDEVVESVYATVREKLEVANPRYAEDSAGSSDAAS